MYRDVHLFLHHGMLSEDCCQFGRHPSNIQTLLWTGPQFGLENKALKIHDEILYRIGGVLYR